MADDNVLDPENCGTELPNIVTAGTPNPGKVINVENPTGRNSHYLSKRRLPFDPNKINTNVQIVAGEKQDDPFIDNIARQMVPGTVANISQEALIYLSNFSKKMRDGYQAAVPLVCLGEDSCPYAKSCPLLKAGLEVPILENCPVEEHLFNTWVDEKMKELGVKQDDPMASIDRSQIREMAELEIIQMRATLEMSNAPETVREKVVGFDEDGKPIVQDVENPRIGIITNIAKVKRDILSDLVGTRKERIRAGEKTNTPVETLAGFAAKAKERSIELEKKRLESQTNERQVEINETTTPNP